MRSKIGALPLLLVGFLLASCASPRGLDEPPLQLPALKPGYGRVYFTRSSDLAGSAIQPEIRMNNEVVGRSVPGGFSFVDRPPGKYAVTTATEVENAVTFQLAAGETKYIKTAVTPGILVGHVTPTLEFPEQGNPTSVASGMSVPNPDRLRGSRDQRLFPGGGSRRGSPGGESRGSVSDRKCLAYAGISLLVMTTPAAFPDWWVTTSVGRSLHRDVLARTFA